MAREHGGVWLGRVAGLAVLAMLPACSHFGTHATSTPTPTPSVPAPSPTPTPPPVTPTVSPSHSASPTPSRSASPRPLVTPTATPSVTPTVQVSEASGATKTIKVGEFMTLRLGLVDTTAAWTFKTKPDAAILTVVSEQTSPPTSPPQADAPGGSHRWVFQGVATGTTSVVVNQAEPGAGAPTIRTYSLTVVVTS